MKQHHHEKESIAIKFQAHQAEVKALEERLKEMRIERNKLLSAYDALQVAGENQ